MKYIIFDNRTPVIFSELIDHDVMAIDGKPGLGDDKPTSAGFINMDDDGRIYTRGESFTLKLKSHKDDVEIIEKYMKEY